MLMIENRFLIVLFGGHILNFPIVSIGLKKNDFLYDM